MAMVGKAAVTTTDQVTERAEQETLGDVQLEGREILHGGVGGPQMGDVGMLGEVSGLTGRARNLSGGSVLGLRVLSRVVRPLGGGAGGRGIRRSRSRLIGSGGARGGGVAGTTMLGETSWSLTYGGAVTTADEGVRHVQL